MIWHQTPSERRTHASLKWSTSPENVLPLWVADMDCAPPNCVKQTINHALAHGIFGYGAEPESFRKTWVQHLKTRHGWTISPDWIVPVPGVVPGMRFSLMASPQVRHVLIPTPAYPYFKTVPSIENRVEHSIQLDLLGDTIETSIGVIEERLKTIKEPAAILWCNPHNPGGKVFSKEFIQGIVRLAASYDALLVSDEIWADLILDDKRHIPCGLVAPNDQPTVTLMAATKTFNIAGFSCAIAIIPDSDIRKRFLDTQTAMPQVSPLAYAVTASCLKDGWSWHDALLEALKNNRQLVMDWSGCHPQMKVITGHSTFLAWIESNNCNDLFERFLDRGVRLSPGALFGSNTAVRLNFGCSPATLTEAFNRLDSAL